MPFIMPPWLYMYLLKHTGIICVMHVLISLVSIFISIEAIRLFKEVICHRAEIAEMANLQSNFTYYHLFRENMEDFKANLLS